jgi:hypothetical protein
MCFALITNKVNILKLVLILSLIPVSNLKLKRSLISKGLNKNRKRFANPPLLPGPFSVWPAPSLPRAAQQATHLSSSPSAQALLPSGPRAHSLSWPRTGSTSDGDARGFPLHAGSVTSFFPMAVVLPQPRHALHLLPLPFLIPSSRLLEP